MKHERVPNYAKKNSLLPTALSRFSERSHTLTKEEEVFLVGKRSTALKGCIPWFLFKLPRSELEVEL